MNTAEEFKKQYDAGIIRGAVIRIGTPDATLCSLAFGLADHIHSTAMTPEAVFDMASVTKAVGVGSALAFLHSEGKIDFDRPFCRYLPEYRGAGTHGVPTVRQLATHTSGIEPERPYDRFLPSGGGEAMVDAVLELDTVKTPGTEYLYCCANYLLLGMLIEKIAGEPLERYVERKLFQPLGMNETSWGIPLPKVRERVVRAHLVTTHGCPERTAVTPELWALHQDDCLPSDETARWALPRRVGNAGIFSTAKDLEKFARWLLKGAPGLRKESLAELTVSCTPSGLHRRSVGWDCEAQTGFSDRVFFHTGWSGQTLWIDPGRKLYGMVLTNRTAAYQNAKAGRLKLMQTELERQ